MTAILYTLSGILKLVCLTGQAHAAPIPATSTSLLVNEKPGLYRSAKGFTVNAGKTEWVLSEAPTEIPSVVTIYKSPEFHRGLQPVLTVRVDELEHNADLKSYMRSSMKDYTLMGFHVLKAKPLKVNSQLAFLIDLDETKAEKRLRQIVFVKNQTAVVMTCRDRPETFEKTVLKCNEIFKSFEWNSSPASSQTGA
jgi:hypothetical protein